jgi:hypothetical protein
MSDSHSLSGNTGHDVTPLSLSNQPADQIRFDCEALDGFPSEISEDVEHAVSQPHACQTTNKSNLFAFEIDAPIYQAPVFPARLQVPTRRLRSVLHRTLDAPAGRGLPIALAGVSQRAASVSRRLVSTASRLAIQLRFLARLLAAITRHAAIAVGAAYRRIGRVPRSRWLAATALLSLVFVAATSDRLTEMSAGFITKSVASGALSSDAIEPTVLTPVRVNAVMPFERLRSAMPQMFSPVRPRSLPPRGTAPANDRGAIQAVLNRYRDALSILDVAAVRAVWPGVDVAAVRSGFARVADQNVEFEACRISSTGVQATASCAGVLESGLNPGQRRPRSERKRWQFTLHKSGNRWQITNVISAALPGSSNERANAAR